MGQPEEANMKDGNDRMAPLHTGSTAPCSMCGDGTQVRGDELRAHNVTHHADEIASLHRRLKVYRRRRIAVERGAAVTPHPFR